MAGQKYYAVRVGYKPGVYLSWDACKEQVHGYPGAQYKSFTTRKEAEAFVQPQQEEDSACPWEEAVAYVDGSYHVESKSYGYGMHLEYQGKTYERKGKGEDPDKASMRNVAGEIDGAMAAVALAIELHIPVLHLYYDYMGIEQWALGAWKANKEWTKEYAAYMKQASKQVQIVFHKVKAHTGVEGNERADKLAKQAVGNV